MKSFLCVRNKRIKNKKKYLSFIFFIFLFAEFYSLCAELATVFYLKTKKKSYTNVQSSQKRALKPFFTHLIEFINSFFFFLNILFLIFCLSPRVFIFSTPHLFVIFHVFLTLFSPK